MIIEENPVVNKRKPWRPIKNLLVLSLATMMQFAAFFSSVNLLSSTQIEDGLGVISQSVLYVAFVISAIFLPPLLFNRLGVKTVVACSILFYSVDIAANFKPSWGASLPMAAITGTASATFWSSAILYTRHLATEYNGDQDAMKSEKVFFTFIGVLMTFYMSCNIWGNIISYEVLKPEGGYLDTSRNVSDYSMCGSNFCDSYATNQNTSKDDILEQPDLDKIRIFTGIDVGIVLLAGVVALAFLDPVPNPNKGKIEIKKLLFATLECLKDPHQILMAPIMILSALDAAFIYSDFTKAYISCSWGIHRIGFVLVTYGVTGSIFAVLCGFLVRIFDRIVIVIFGLVVLAVCVTVLWIYTPTSENHWVLFVVAGLWGVSDSIFQVQVKGIYGTIFDEQKEASLALMSVFEGLGYLIGYSYSSYLCTFAKLLILAIVSLISLIGYVATEFSYRRKLKQIIVVNYIT